jgi:3-oxoacyl-[acyl-carrier-protein] synthase II
MGGFNANALSTRNDDPTTASRPMDRTETVRFRRGAGALIEEYEHAIARGATIYCEIGGGGMSADAYTYYASIGAKCNAQLS